MAMIISQLFKHWTYQVFAPGALLRTKYDAFRKLLRLDEACLQLIAELEEIHFGQEYADWTRIAWLCERLCDLSEQLVQQLQSMNPTRYMDLPEYLRKIIFYTRFGLDLDSQAPAPDFICPLDQAAQHPELAGGKAVNLATARERTSISIPPGRVATTAAYAYFMEASGLRPRVDQLLRQVRLSAPEELEQLSATLQSLILDAETPELLRRDLESAAAELCSAGGLLAVRSSARAEDGQVSFAGQYKSMLRVRPKDIDQAYKQVLASKYAPHALVYRILHGLADDEAPMAVLLMPMVRIRAAGVIYTKDQDRTQTLQGMLSIHAIRTDKDSGTEGEALVAGLAESRVYCFSRAQEPVPMQWEDENPPLTAPLTLKQARQLAVWAMELETLFGAPQDIEWVLDLSGNPHILQSRAHVSEAPPEPPESLPGSAPEAADGGAELPADRSEAPARVLLEQAGVRASSGVGCGRVKHIRTVAELSALPAGSVAVTPYLWPDLALALPRLAAVVAQTGSRASHFASIARARGLPVLSGVENAFGLLPEETEVTVDAVRGMVLAGKDETLLRSNAGAPRIIGPSLDRLTGMARYLFELNLTDPSSESFTPQGCKSLHDITRFAHEKAVAEMFSLVDKGGRGLGRAMKLTCKLPVAFYLLDLGGGVFEAARHKKELNPDDIRNASMWSFWEGFTSPDIPWSDDLPHMDWEQFDSVSAGIFSKDAKFLASYVILGEDYLHLMLRFGYHFSVLDCLCGENHRTNYINFRFKGGGGSMEQRHARLVFLRRLLEEYGFTVNTTGDMLDAAHPPDQEAVLQRKLYFLGRIIAKSRLMDISLSGPQEALDLAEEFLESTRRLVENS